MLKERTRAHSAGDEMTLPDDAERRRRDADTHRAIARADVASEATCRGERVSCAIADQFWLNPKWARPSCPTGFLMNSR